MKKISIGDHVRFIGYDPDRVDCRAIFHPPGKGAALRVVHVTEAQDGRVSYRVRRAKTVISALANERRWTFRDTEVRKIQKVVKAGAL